MENSTIEKYVTSMKEADLTGLFWPMIAIYRIPKDYPGKYVARIYDLDKPTNVVMIKDTLEELQEDIGKNTKLIYIPRSIEDHETVEGVWI